jgi:hypothetical protein
MFMLYPIVLAVAIGRALGGRLENLSAVRLRWAGLAAAGLVAQVVLFWGPVSGAVGDVGPPIYVASSVLVLLVVLRNLRVAGLVLVAAGAASNLAAIVANGGYMPASPGALDALGWSPGSGYSNSREFAEPALGALGDVFALPSWLPLANVFSVGDVLIGVGVGIAIAWAMTRPVARPVVRSDNSPE